MKILVTGATGFIGSHVVLALYLAGHQVRCAVRNPARARRYFSNCEYVQVDFSNARSVNDWLPHLRGIDAVINTVGIFEQKNQDTRFSAIHEDAPCALFSACAIANVRRVVQVSALGAELGADTEFLRSKARADAFLLQKNIQSMVLQPSLIFGAGGASSELFVKLALLPVLPLPDGGEQIVQPVHIDDIVTAVLRYIEETPLLASRRVAAVGTEALRVRDYLHAMRSALGHAPAVVIAISSNMLMRLSRWLPLPWLSSDALRMLQRGNCADTKDFAVLLGRAPLSAKNFAATALTIHAELKLRWAFAALRYSIALLWILTGIISLGIYPIESSKELLARAGIVSNWQEPLLYLAALLDIAFGIATLWARLKWIWYAQIATIVFYSAVIAWKLPEFWLHPYAPMLKNIPLLAAIYLLMTWEAMTCESITLERSHVRRR